jgi:hypothetical protein
VLLLLGAFLYQQAIQIWWRCRWFHLLKVDKEKVDLGDVKLGQTVMVSFQLTNLGDKTLKFTKAPYVEVLEGC